MNTKLGLGWFLLAFALCCFIGFVTFCSMWAGTDKGDGLCGGLFFTFLISGIAGIAIVMEESD